MIKIAKNYQYPNIDKWYVLCSNLMSRHIGLVIDWHFKKYLVLKILFVIHAIAINVPSVPSVPSCFRDTRTCTNRVHVLKRLCIHDISWRHVMWGRAYWRNPGFSNSQQVRQCQNVLTTGCTVHLSVFLQQIPDVYLFCGRCRQHSQRLISIITAALSFVTL